MAHRRFRLMFAVLATLATAPVIAQQTTERFYIGAGLDLAAHTARQDGLGYSDTPLGTTVYGGMHLRDRVAVEAAWQSFSSVSSGTILGSGISRLTIDSDVRVVIVRAVLKLDLGDAFSRAARWTLFAAAGPFSLDESRRVNNLTFGTNEESNDAQSGVAIGAGALYDLERLRLRAAIEQRDGGDTEQTSLGVTAEFRF
jgi:hypothetical protein